jgi:endonuclease V-like protein UPF0215 family
MVDLSTLLRRRKTIGSVGFDDAPFVRHSGQPVMVAGVICANTRFEGMVWGQVQQDGLDATDTLAHLLLAGKFLTQIDVVLLDGISLGGGSIWLT